jgi:hypothetical protein
LLAKGNNHYCDNLGERINLDYSDHDSVLQAVVSKKIDRVVAGANDFASLTATKVNTALGLLDDNLKQWNQINLKDHFAKMIHDIDLPRVQTYSLVDCDLNLFDSRYPLILKAHNLTGGKGVKKIYSRGELDYYIDKFRKTYNVSSFVLQEFVQGPIFSVTGSVSNTVFTPSLFFEEYINPGEYWIKGAKTLALGPETKELMSSAQIQIQSICEYLGLLGGIVHAQFFIVNGEAVLFDVTRRIPGDMLIHAVKLARGPKAFTNLVDNYLFSHDTYDVNEEYSDTVLRNCQTGEPGTTVSSATPSGFSQELLDFYPGLNDNEVIKDKSTKVAIEFFKWENGDLFSASDLDFLSNRVEYPRIPGR